MARWPVNMRIKEMLAKHGRFIEAMELGDD